LRLLLIVGGVVRLEVLSWPPRLATGNSLRGRGLDRDDVRGRRLVGAGEGELGRLALTRGSDQDQLTSLYDPAQQVGWSTYVEIDPYTHYEAAQVATCKGPGE